MWPTSDDLLTRSIYDSSDDVGMAVHVEDTGYTVHPNVGLKPDDEEPAATYACLCYDFIVEAVLMGTLCIFGFAGNTVATVCLRNDKSKTATPFLLVSLEVADTLFLVAVFGLRVLTSIDTFSGPLPGLHVAYPFLGRVVYPWALAAETGTIYLTVLVTVNRYISVCWPYRVSDWCSVRCARRHVAAVAAFSIVFNLPRFFEYEYGPEPSAPSIANNSAGFESQLTTLSSGAFVVQHMMTTVSSTDLQVSAAEVMMADGVNKPSSGQGTPSEDGDVQLTLQQSALSVHPLYRLIYSNVLYSIVMFFIPLVSLTFLNQRLIVALRQTQKKRQSLLRGSTSNAGVSGRNPSRSTTSNSAGRDGDSSGSSSRSEEDITFMLIVVVMVFVLTQAPAAVTQAFESRLDEKKKACPSPYFYYVRISDLLVVANSSLNFVIYCLCSRRFRHILMTVVCRCPCLPNGASPGYDLGNRSVVVNGASRRTQQLLTTPVTRPPEHQPLASPASPDDGLVTMSSSRSTQRERRGTMESVTTRGDVTTADQTENLMNDTGCNDPDDVISSV